MASSTSIETVKYQTGRNSPCQARRYTTVVAIAVAFLFTDAFDQWSDEQFKAHIYNDLYYLVDPEYVSKRPISNAEVVVRLWGQRKAQTRVLDYGGGNDVFCGALRANGFPVAVTYDPMMPEYSSRPSSKFDLVSTFLCE